MLRKKIAITVEHYKAKLKGLKQTLDGSEIPDPTPMAPPVGYIKQPSMVDNIRNLIRSERLRQDAETAGAETFDEADDFDIEDDPEPISQYDYEPEFDPPLPPAPPAPSPQATTEGPSPTPPPPAPGPTPSA